MTALRPWREVAIPHSDVLQGTFQQAEFAADISGKAPDIYKDAALFFDRTYITEGMALLLTQVAQRLAGKGGEPVIQLQTAFGGGKISRMTPLAPGWRWSNDGLRSAKCTVRHRARITDRSSRPIRQGGPDRAVARCPPD